MPDHPPVSAEDVPQSVVEAVLEVKAKRYGFDVDRRIVVRDLAAALAEYEKQGYRLVHNDEGGELKREVDEARREWDRLESGDDEATVERLRRIVALCAETDEGLSTSDAIDLIEALARAALTAARGGEE